MQRSKKSSKWRFRGFAYSGTRRLRDPPHSRADWPDHPNKNLKPEPRTEWRRSRRPPASGKGGRHRILILDNSAPPLRNGGAIPTLVGSRSTADSSPKQFASGGLRFEEACEDCRSVTTVSGSIGASSEMASDDSRGALLIFSVNSATDAGAKCASEGKGPASGTSGVCGAWRTTGGRSRCAHSKTRFTIAQARSKRLLSLTPGVAAPTRSPSYGIASAPRSSAAAQRRRSALSAGVTPATGKDIVVKQRVIGSAAALDS